jgi:hypothetical protein
LITAAVVPITVPIPPHQSFHPIPPGMTQAAIPATSSTNPSPTPAMVATIRALSTIFGKANSRFERASLASSSRSVHSARASRSPASRAARICSRITPWGAALLARRTHDRCPCTVV